jgi:pimeloyl-ACP methyl ester carboxylesterase
VLSVIEALKLTRPVLAGHSIGGEEMSSIGSRHPERVAGLVYLEAGYPYAWYDPNVHEFDSTVRVDLAELQAKLGQLSQGDVGTDTSVLIRRLIDTTLPRFEADLRALQADLDTLPPALPELFSSPLPPIARAIFAGEQEYTKISDPILAIFAMPPDFGPPPGGNPSIRAAFEAKVDAEVETQVKSFEAGNPTARVVRLPHANHYVFRSNEDDVIREMKAFIGNLP